MVVLTASVRRFLGKPRIARLVTVGPDGYPQMVPIKFMRDGDEIVVTSDAGERKVLNAQANPKGAIQVGGDPDVDEAGYMFQGDLSVEDDVGHVIARRKLYHYYSRKEAEEYLKEIANDELVTIRLKPKKVIRVW